MGNAHHAHGASTAPKLRIPSQPTSAREVARADFRGRDLAQNDNEQRVNQLKNGVERGLGLAVRAASRKGHPSAGGPI